MILKQLRLSRHLSQEQLAQMSGLNVRTIQRIESGHSASVESLKCLAKDGKRHLYIDGGITIQRFLDAGLINEITITRIPVVLGSGIPLFHNSGREHALRLIAGTSSQNGFVQERYEVVPER
jgi:dihydrofolate reductase